MSGKTASRSARRDAGAKTPAGQGLHTVLAAFFNEQRRAELGGIVWWAAGLLVLAALWPHALGQNALGPAGEIIFRTLFFFFGIEAYLLPFLMLAIGWVRFRQQRVAWFSVTSFGLVLGFFSLAVLLELSVAHPFRFEEVSAFYAWEGAAHFWQSIPSGLQLWSARYFPIAGFPAYQAASFLEMVVSTTGAYIITITCLAVAIYCLELDPLLHRFLLRLWIWTRNRFKRPQHETRGSRTEHPSLSPIAFSQKTEPTALPPQKTATSKIKIHMPTSFPAAPTARKTAEPVAQPQARPAAESQAVSAKPETEREYQLPGLELLSDPPQAGRVDPAYFHRMSQTLENALQQFGVKAKVVEVCPGPVVTRYELEPSPGVKVSRILNLADDIALAMRAQHVRLEAPIPGKGAVGIEIPNIEKQVVGLKELLASQAFVQAQSLLTVAVGKDIGGAHVLASLEHMPHLLIAGATGSGKSACINSLICSLLYKATPRQLKLILIDPKRVELTNYEGIPHLKSPVITDSREAAAVLRLLVAEMEQRYKRLAELGVRNIAAYNEAVAAEAAPAAADAGAPLLTFMPYIVVVIDELADMMMVAANDVEAALTRLAQMSRAVGIHLVLATQRPSVDVITGIIKANFPSRIAFQVSSKVDSRTILDTNGADALLGRGDMLYAPASAGKPIRVQGVFVPTGDVDTLARFWKKQGAPELDQAFAPHKLRAESRSGDDEEHDEFFEEAVGWVVRAKQASTSLLQRRLKVGYARAARLLDKMEERGIIGPQEGSKPRKVLLDASSLEIKNQPAETP